MNKKITLYLLLLSGTLLTGCSNIQSYLTQTLPTPASTSPTLATAPLLEYNFLQPRHSALPQATTARLDEASNNPDRFTYYSASGHQCYTLSLNSLQSACNINGQWVALAPILNNRYE